MQIIKSPIDRREFRYIQLQNGLEALLVNDPATQKAAASLSVSVGSNSDTVDGLAHFLEHMLFMGSSKYPDENQYNEVVNENGGYTNAYTDSDHTNYYFTCTPDGLFKVLDIFAQFFISPLLKDDSVEREIHAVDSEYKNGLTNDAWRFHGVKREFMNKMHPMSRFNVGSVETLNIPNIRETVLNFYNSYYSSHLMKLVIVGKHSLDELENNVKSMFSSVPRRNVTINSDYGVMFNAPIYGHIVPMKDENKLDLSWEFWLSDDYDLFHIDEFISHIIGHEGPGSLFDILYQQFLVKSLSAGIEQSSTNHKTLSVTIHLTDLGFSKVDTVRQIVLSYIKMFSKSTYDSVSALYEEFKYIRETKFKNYTIESADNVCTKTSAYWATHSIKPEHLIAHNYIFNEYNVYIHNLMLSILMDMTSKNSVTFLRSRTFDNDNCSIDKWYNVKYIKYDANILKNNDVDIKLTLPQRNDYICTNISLINNNNDNSDPILLDFANMNLYLKQDTSFNTPNVDFRLNLVLPSVSKTCKDIVLSRLFFECFEHSTNANIYNINCANYHTSFSRSNNGLYIYINGYPEKFMNVIRAMVESFLNLKSNITNDMFENVKLNYRQSLENFIFNAPYRIINYQLSSHIENNVYQVDDMLKTLELINITDILNYDPLGDYIVMYGLIQGNISKDCAIEIGKYISKLNPTTGKYKPNDYIKKLDTNEFSEELKNKSEVNSCYKLSIKLGYMRPDINNEYTKILSYIDVLNLIISEQFFDQLRTKEQLGYIVQGYKSSYGNTQEQPFVTYDFCVQSPHKDGNYLKERTMRFIKEFREYLLQKSEDSINKVIQAQILSLEAPFQNLETYASYNFIVISQYCSNFNFRNDKKTIMKTINKENLVKFYDDYFSLSNNSYWSIMLNQTNFSNL